MRYNDPMNASVKLPRITRQPVCPKATSALTLLAAGVILCLTACSAPSRPLTDQTSALQNAPLIQQQQPSEQPDSQLTEPTTEEPAEDTATVVEEQKSRELPDISLVEDYREGFVHGDKGSSYQKYIVLHDTEGDAGPASVIDWWDGNGNLVAAHFIVGRDGTVYQCVPLDKIAHHAGYGDKGHNSAYGITEDGRDDMMGSVWVGDWAPDYGMNAWSVGIEMVHVGGSGYYPEEQLDALDALIAYIDAFYGFESAIIDHKAWRSGNSDTSPEFAEYLYSYQDHRRHTA